VHDFPPIGPRDTLLPASVLVTGARGDLGRRTIRALSSLPLVRGLDRVAASEIRADLTEPADRWRGNLDGVDVLIHLAAEATPAASRADVQRTNIDATRALLQAATQAGVRRVVFASSCHVLAGYRFGKEPLGPDALPFPVSAYGWSKMVSEEDGRLWAAAAKSSFLALRIGMCLRGDDALTPDSRLSLWTQSKLLTAQDYAQAILRATTADVEGYHAMTICSAVEGARWDHGTARTVIGYCPTPLPAPRASLLVQLAERRDRAMNWVRGGPRRYV